LKGVLGQSATAPLRPWLHLSPASWQRTRRQRRRRQRRGSAGVAATLAELGGINPTLHVTPIPRDAIHLPGVYALALIADTDAAADVGGGRNGTSKSPVSSVDAMHRRGGGNVLTDTVLPLFELLHAFDMTPVRRAPRRQRRRRRAKKKKTTTAESARFSTTRPQQRRMRRVRDRLLRDARNDVRTHARVPRDLYVLTPSRVATPPSTPPRPWLSANKKRLASPPTTTPSPPSLSAAPSVHAWLNMLSPRPVASLHELADDRLYCFADVVVGVGARGFAGRVESLFPDPTTAATPHWEQPQSCVAGRGAVVRAFRDFAWRRLQLATSPLQARALAAARRRINVVVNLCPYRVAHAQRVYVALRRRYHGKRVRVGGDGDGDDADALMATVHVYAWSSNASSSSSLREQLAQLAYTHVFVTTAGFDAYHAAMLPDYAAVVLVPSCASLASPLHRRGAAAADDDDDNGDDNKDGDGGGGYDVDDVVAAAAAPPMSLRLSLDAVARAESRADGWRYSANNPHRTASGAHNPYDYHHRTVVANAGGDVDAVCWHAGAARFLDSLVHVRVRVYAVDAVVAVDDHVSRVRAGSARVNSLSTSTSSDGELGHEHHDEKPEDWPTDRRVSINEQLMHTYVDDALRTVVDFVDEVATFTDTRAPLDDAAYGPYRELHMSEHTATSYAYVGLTSAHVHE
jgi:hypothetical protein